MRNEGLCNKTGPLNRTRGFKYINNPSSVVYVPELNRALPNSILHQTIVMTSSKFHEYLIKLIKVISVKTTALSAPFKDWKALKKKREFQNLEFRLKPLYSRKNFTPL